MSCDPRSCGEPSSEGSRPRGRSKGLAPEVLFGLLSDRTRLRLLNLLHHGEVCVCFFVEVLDAPQPTISRHLAALRSAGLVEVRREGKWMHYSLSPDLDEATRTILHSALNVVAEEKQMKKDLADLDRACCSPKAPEILRRAPRPQMTGSA